MNLIKSEFPDSGLKVELSALIRNYGDVFYAAIFSWCAVSEESFKRIL